MAGSGSAPACWIPARKPMSGHAYGRPPSPEAVLDDQTGIAEAIVRRMALPSNS